MGCAVSSFQRQQGVQSLAELGRQSSDDDVTAVEVQFDMWLISASDFVQLDRLLPHQELLAQNKLVRWHPAMHTVFFVSHQWTAFREPDPTGTQLRCFQKTLLRMLTGDLPPTRPTFADSHLLPPGVSIEAKEWQARIPHAYIWMDYLSFPQLGCCASADEARAAEVDLVKAIRSIPGYVERCSHFFTLCPSIQHRDLPGVMCTFGTWLDRGWCRVELIALLLARQRKPPAIVIKSTEGAPFMIAPMQGTIRPPGMGSFTCCARNHELVDSDGTVRTIKCDKEAISALLTTLLTKRLEFYFGRDELLDFRLWQACTPHFLKGTGLQLHGVGCRTPTAASFFDAYVYSPADVARREAHESKNRWSQSHWSAVTGGGAVMGVGRGRRRGPNAQGGSQVRATADGAVSGACASQPSRSGVLSGGEGSGGASSDSSGNSSGDGSAAAVANGAGGAGGADGSRSVGGEGGAGGAGGAGGDSSEGTRSGAALSARSEGVRRLAKHLETEAVSGLHYAVASGSVQVARQLLQLGADPNAKCRVAYQSLMVVKAMTPLHFAVTACAAHHEEMVALLIGAHADVNALMEGGCTPLMAAAFINLDGVNALLAVDGLEVDKPGFNDDTALGLAAFQGPTECVRALVAAKANLAHVKATGSTHLMSACDNPGVTEAMLELLIPQSETDGGASIEGCDAQQHINTRRRPQTARWAALYMLFEFLHRRGLRGDLVMEVAHMRGGTALHEASLKGNALAVRWLLAHGAHRSLYVRNRLGYRPLEVARAFGPFPEVEALLGGCMLDARFDVRFANQRGEKLLQRNRHRLLFQRPSNGVATQSSHAETETETETKPEGQGRSTTRSSDSGSFRSAASVGSFRSSTSSTNCVAALPTHELLGAPPSAGVPSPSAPSTVPSPSASHGSFASPSRHPSGASPPRLDSPSSPRGGFDSPRTALAASSMSATSAAATSTGLVSSASSSTSVFSAAEADAHTAALSGALATALDAPAPAHGASAPLRSVVALGDVSLPVRGASPPPATPPLELAIELQPSAVSLAFAQQCLSPAGSCASQRSVASAASAASVDVGVGVGFPRLDARPVTRPRASLAYYPPAEAEAPPRSQPRARADETHAGAPGAASVRELVAMEAQLQAQMAQIRLQLHQFASMAEASTAMQQPLRDSGYGSDTVAQ